MRVYLVAAVLLAGCDCKTECVSPSVEVRSSEMASLLSAGTMLVSRQDQVVGILKQHSGDIREIADKVAAIQSSAEKTQEAVSAILTAQEAVQVESETANGKEVISSVSTPSEVQVTPASDGVRLQFWTAPWCVYCPVAKRNAQAAADELGIKLELFDADVYKDQLEKCRIETVPTLCIANNGMIREWLKGNHSKRDIIDAVNKVRGVVPVVKQRKVRQRLPVASTPWGVIDLETYRRNCSCPMCQGIRAMQWEYRQKPEFMEVVEPVQDATFTPNDVPVKESGDVPPQQEPTPDVTLHQMIDILSLSPEDVLADLGCGDGRILIAAVKQYGCRGVGIEIDPARAEIARSMVSDACLSDRIEIITGDALQFDPDAYGATALTAYLYPELLAQLADKFKAVRIGASPFHEVPGLNMVRNGDVWVYRRQT